MLAFILRNILPKVINTFTALEEALDVLCIKTGHATFATGKSLQIPSLFMHGKCSFLMFNFRQLLLCRVTLGKSFLQFNAMKMAHAPPGHHSVVGRPSVGGLSFPEYVVYRGEQVIVKDLISILKCQQNKYLSLFFLLAGLPRVLDLLSDYQTRLIFNE